MCKILEINSIFIPYQEERKRCKWIQLFFQLRVKLLQKLIKRLQKTLYKLIEKKRINKENTSIEEARKKPQKIIYKKKELMKIWEEYSKVHR